MSRTRAPVIVSLVGLACILALRVSACGSARVGAGALTAGVVGFTPSADGALALWSSGFREELKLAVDVDGLAAPLSFGTVGDGGYGATASIEIEGQRYEARVTLTPDAETQSLAVALEVPAQGSGEHELALRVELPKGTFFALGSGELSDVTPVETRAVVALGEHPIALASPSGLVAAAEVAQDALRLVARSRGVRAAQGGRADVRVIVGSGSADAWTHVWSALGERTELVSGAVTGARGAAEVIGIDREGAQQVRFTTDASGRFHVRAPPAVVRWYAGQSVARSSAPTLFVPGQSGELTLDLSEGGELVVHVVDPDARAPLTARVFVHGVEGTLDPSFGPDWRASGAGPLIDALRGEISTPLPVGHYRVSAMKGPEWSIDAKDFAITSSKQTEITLAPRHVIDTPGQVACDLHVHARPSFDSPVSPEDRVLSLVAAGIELAVPSEHNIVGDYSAAIAALGLEDELSFVPGVEVTTYAPFFGHFGVYPYPASLGVPPYKDTSPEKLFAAARRGGDPRRVIQVNHPRMGRRIGYFDWMGWSRDGGAPPSGARMDFDAIELMNGYEMATPDKLELVLHDWFALLSRGRRFVITGSSDSHRIQYTWAGYPRTLVTSPDRPIDPERVALDIKHGHAVVTSGPILDFDVNGARPGDEIGSGALEAHVRVRAAPWIDVTSVEIWSGGAKPTGVAEGDKGKQTWKLEASSSVDPKPMHVGPEDGSLEEARARTARLEKTFVLQVGEGSTWIVAIARGARRMDDALPFMPIVPWAVTNPIWVKGQR